MLQGHIQLFGVALAIAAVGFLANYFLNDKLKDAVSGGVRFLGIPLGNGLIGLLSATGLALALTVACFWQASFLCFFPGINIAFELGGMGVVCLRYFQARRKS